MHQIPLSILPRLPYDASTFYLHAGVSEDIGRCLALFSKDVFKICFFEGQRRSGKTHLSIKLFDELLGRGFHPELVYGGGLSELAGRFSLGESCSERDVIIVDSAHEYFMALTPGKSGEFVAFIETLRTRKAGIILLSSSGVDTFPCDDHVLSRLRPGLGLQIGTPSHEDLPIVLNFMARQRGIKLTDKHLAFLSKRLRLDIASIERYLEELSSISDALGVPIKLPVISEAVNLRRT